MGRFVLHVDLDQVVAAVEREIREDPVLKPRGWRSGDDSAYGRFRNRILKWTEDEAEPN